MRVEIVANKLSDKDQATGELVTAVKGDVFEVPNAYGRKLCDAGWAIDVSDVTGPEGPYPSKPFMPGAGDLKVHKAAHKKGGVSNG